MKYNEIRQMAKGMNINTYRIKKTDLIRAIQRAENNIDCYGTSRIETCGEERCLWKDDCLTLYKKG